MISFNFLVIFAVMKRNYSTYILITAGLILVVCGCVACAAGRNNKKIQRSPAWLELPKVEGNLYTHTMDLDGKSMRNWSFVWDEENLVAPWIAYPLNKDIIGNNIKRTNNWSLDPLIPKDKQPILFKGYREGNDGWRSRGHQIASADRLHDFAQNSTTFYFTNMTPQEKDFNGQIWNDLEMKVRRTAGRCDTLYVITGCVTKGSTTYCKDNNGKHVTIPTAYYKALLAYKKDPKFGHKGYLGCAYYIEHKQQPTTIKKDRAISIDELEKILGMDLFANLPNVLDARTADLIESEDPVNVKFW